MPNNHRNGKKRAIALAGGGPAAGLHIGALAALEEAHISFDVFSLSCIGAWVGIVYNTRRRPVDDQGRTPAAQTFDFFNEYCFRDDDSYEWFPLNRGFAMDFVALGQALAKFGVQPPLDISKLLPTSEETVQSMQRLLHVWATPDVKDDPTFNYWILDDFLAVNPATRYLTSLIFKCGINGLSRIYYKHSQALRDAFQGDRLCGSDMPHIYHNAWRMPANGKAGKLQIFHNRPGVFQGARDYQKITPQTLCACSALPYIEESVKIGDDEYTEGALVDTVNFANLLRDHPDLDEIWVSRIVDEAQVKPARDLAGALANLPMQFAAEVGEDDIKLFREHLANQTVMHPRVVEIPICPSTQVTFEWKHSNLKQGFREGYEAVRSLLEFDPALKPPRARTRQAAVA